MDQEEYKKWENDAKHCLSVKYNQEEIGRILEWFRSIKASDERDLIGSDRVESFSQFYGYNKNWNLYDSLMARLWVYAPYILELKD